MSYMSYNEESYFGLRGKALYEVLFRNQKKFIEYCENNGRSYTGPNGLSIREADINELQKIKLKLSKYR